jgi:hypothetical protein
MGNGDNGSPNLNFRRCLRIQWQPHLFWQFRDQLQTP